MLRIALERQAQVGGGIKTYDVRISSEGTKNQRAHCYETNRSRALDTGGENPDSNHGGVAVVSYGLDRASFNQGKNAKFGFSVDEELAPSLVAKGPGGGISETVGSLCARDYKGVGNQYVDEGKCIIQQTND